MSDEELSRTITEIYQVIRDLKKRMEKLEKLSEQSVKKSYQD